MNETSPVTRATHPWVAAGAQRVRFATGFGAQFLASLGEDWSASLELVRAAEDLGFDAYWNYDHPKDAPDCWMYLAALSVCTTRIRLGSLVSSVYYRSPPLLARCAADVDQLSRGRLVLGVGGGDDPAEARQLGVARPSGQARVQGVEEAVHIIRGLWTGGPFTFTGEQFGVTDATFGPRPAQSPAVPLLIAGAGEATLRQVARYADASNFGAHERIGGAMGIDSVKEKLELLRRQCDAVCRPYESILKTFTSLPVVVGETPTAVRRKLDAIPEPIRVAYASSMVVGTPSELIEYYRPLVAAGIQYVIAAVVMHDVDTLRLLAEQVLPALQPD